MDERENPYPGVNAHLNSVLQANEDGDWEMFHAAYINDLARQIDAILPPGYVVGMEKSLQVREYHPEGEDEIALRSAVIYDIRTQDKRQPVVRIELLSPTNKPPGDGFIQYAEKRDTTLFQRLPLVEIDLLHEQPPVPRTIPSYADQHPGATPYTIYLTDTRRSVEDGSTRVYGFGVDDAIPSIIIPLAEDDQLEVDFNAPYRRTFRELSYFREVVDYHLVPPRFETYWPDDQLHDRVHQIILKMRS